MDDELDDQQCGQPTAMMDLATILLAIVLAVGAVAIVWRML